MKYLLMIKIPIEAIDNLDARLQVREILKKKDLDKEQVKLQRLYDNKPPEGVKL